MSNLQPVSDERLHGRTLVLARVVWFVITVLAVGLYLLGIPIHYALFQTVCSGASWASCGNLQLTPELARQLQQLGLSVGFYALYFTAFVMLTGLVDLLVALVIFWRRSDDWMAMYVSLMLIAWGVGGGVTLGSDANAILRLITVLLNVLGNSCVALFFFIFPDGRFVPRWTRWLAPFAILREVLGVFLPDNALIQNLFFVLVPFALLMQLYRYRRVSTAVQRQQTKWVVFGVTVGVGGYAAVLLFVTLTSPNGQPTSILAYILGGTALFLFLLLIPLSIGMAILRSHLFDIDLLIRRTLQYSLLSGLLALAYFGLVVVLQTLFTAAGGKRSELVTVLSTLIIAALFLPLRRRVQDIIDRRFYRKKYDAAKTLAAFAATVRDETDLDKLTASLINVVQETMQPEHVSLWLKPTDREGKR